MAYLFDAVGFPIGSRMTDLWNNTWADDPRGDEVATGHLINLPADQHGELESDFLSSHLPFHVGGVGGRYPNGDSWFLVMSKAPADMSSRLFAQPDPFWVLRDSLDRALAYNPQATVGAEFEWTAQDLRQVYMQAEPAGSGIAAWPVADLLRGLLAECCNVPLADIAAGYPVCGFPRKDHVCEGDGFNEVFVAWQRLQIPQEEEPPDAQPGSAPPIVTAPPTETVTSDVRDRMAEPAPDGDGGSVDLDQVERRLRTELAHRYKGRPVRIDTDRLDGDGPVRVRIWPTSRAVSLDERVCVAATGVVEFCEPDDGCTPISAPTCDRIPTFDDDEAVAAAENLVDSAVARVQRLTKRHHEALLQHEPDLPLDLAMLAAACARWQASRDGGSTLLRAGARVLLDEPHYFQAAFITRNEEKAAADPDVLAQAAALLSGVNASPTRTADEWCAKSGVSPTGFAGRGLAAKPTQDKQISAQLDRGTIRMPLWGVSLDPAVAVSFAGTHPRWIFQIVGEFRAIPAWLHSGVKPGQQELICGGEFQVLSRETEGPVTTVRLQYLNRIGNRVGSDPTLLELIGQVTDRVSSSWARHVRAGESQIVETLDIEISGGQNLQAVVDSSGPDVVRTLFRPWGTLDVHNPSHPVWSFPEGDGPTEVTLPADAALIAAHVVRRSDPDWLLLRSALSESLTLCFQSREEQTGTHGSFDLSTGGYVCWNRADESGSLVLIEICGGTTDTPMTCETVDLLAMMGWQGPDNTSGNCWLALDEDSEVGWAADRILLGITVALNCQLVDLLT